MGKIRGSNYSEEQIASYTPAELARSVNIVQPDGEIDYLFIPTDLQAEIMAAQEPNLFIWGNRGGGKSVCIRWMCHVMAATIPNFRYAILRTSFPELTKNHIIYLDDEMDRFDGFYHKTEHCCYYPNGSKGFYAQCANDADVKNILGVEAMLIVFDEAPTFKWEHMRLIAGSVRIAKNGKSPKGLKPMTRYMGNPVGESIDELWKYFIDKDVDLTEDPEYRPQDFRAIEIRMQENPHLDVEEYRRQFVGIPVHFRKAWLDGTRVFERTLFDYQKRKEIDRGGDKVSIPWHEIDEFPEFGDGKPVIYRATEQDKETGEMHAVWHVPEWIRIYRSYDHGFWPDPAVCEWFAVIGKRIIVFHEKTWFRTIAKDIAEDIAEESRGLKVVTTYCDPTIDIKTGADVKTIREVMEDEGKFPMDPSINNREYFADKINAALEEEVEPGIPRIQVYARGCPMLAKYLPRMKYDEHNTRAMADHKFDHWPIALAYFLMSTIPETKPAEVAVVKKWMKTKVGSKRVLGSNSIRGR